MLAYNPHVDIIGSNPIVCDTLFESNESRFRCCSLLNELMMCVDHAMNVVQIQQNKNKQTRFVSETKGNNILNNNLNDLAIAVKSNDASNNNDNINNCSKTIISSNTIVNTSLNLSHLHMDAVAPMSISMFECSNCISLQNECRRLLQRINELQLELKCEKQKQKVICICEHKKSENENETNQQNNIEQQQYAKQPEKENDAQEEEKEKTNKMQPQNQIIQYTSSLNHDTAIGCASSCNHTNNVNGNHKDISNNRDTNTDIDKRNQCVSNKDTASMVGNIYIEKDQSYQQTKTMTQQHSIHKQHIDRKECEYNSNIDIQNENNNNLNDPITITDKDNNNNNNNLVTTYNPSSLSFSSCAAIVHEHATQLLQMIQQLNNNSTDSSDTFDIFATKTQVDPTLQEMALSSPTSSHSTLCIPRCTCFLCCPVSRCERRCDDMIYPWSISSLLEYRFRASQCLILLSQCCCKFRKRLQQTKQYIHGIQQHYREQKQQYITEMQQTIQHLQQQCSNMKQQIQKQQYDMQQQYEEHKQQQLQQQEKYTLLSKLCSQRKDKLLFASKRIVHLQKEIRINKQVIITTQQKYENVFNECVNLRELLHRCEDNFTLLSECIICKDKPRSAIFFQCKHMICCDECAARIERERGSLCPICRTPITIFGTKGIKFT